MATRMMLAGLMALLVAGAATANRGGGGNGRKSQEVSCAVLLEPEIELGVTSLAVTRRVPAYPGQWWSPIITWVFLAPAETGVTELYRMVQTFQGLVSSNRASMPFELTVEQGLQSGDEVLVQVTVEEHHQTAYCEASTFVVY